MVNALKEELLDKDQQLKRALQEISTVNAKNTEHIAMIKCLNEQVMDTHGMIAHLQSKEIQVKEESRAEDFLQGIELYCRKIFLTSPGQKFIKDLVEGVAESYQKSSQYLEDIAPYMSHFIKHGFQSAVSQAQEKGFSDKLRLARARVGITPSPYFKEDLEAPLDGEWWMPVSRKAAHYLMREDYLASELPPADPLVSDFLAPLSHPKVTFIIPTLLISFLSKML